MRLFGGIGGRFKWSEPVYIRGAVALLIACAVVYALYLSTASKEKKVAAKKAELASFDKLRDEYATELSIVAPLEKKLSQTRPGLSAGSIIEEIASGIGIKKNVASFKPLETKSDKGYEQSGVEVRVEGVTLNQLMNLIYRMEKHESLLLVREFSMKSRFDNPDLFDARLHVELVSRRP
ncbi:MAG: hypothetical protein HZB84_07670 [Deltaproteobacteria bacterium]|nr:hypothetical protein [Deltaproteobacteria bacterium]